MGAMSETEQGTNPDERGAQPSKSQRKREMLALQDLGAALVDLGEGQLARLDLPEELRAAIDEARRIRQRGARKRQLQYIGRLMRAVDAEPIRAALAGIHQRDREAVQRHHQAECWRERLLAEGDRALGHLGAEIADLDRQRVRQWVRAAQAESREGKPPRAARALFRYLRERLRSPGE